MGKNDVKKEFKFFQVLIEIGIITIGILIAYQLNNWKEVRATHEAEEKMLKEIRSNLQLDLIDLNDNGVAHITAIKLIDSLKKIAESDVYSKRVPQMLRDALRDFVFNPQTSSFETLKAQGVNLIRNDSIRIRILRLYDFNYRTIEKVEETYVPHQFIRHFDHIVLSYFDGYDLNEKEGAIPINSGTDWLKKSDIKNRLDLTRAEHRFAIRLYDECIAEVKDLITTIDNELKNEF